MRKSRGAAFFERVTGPLLIVSFASLITSCVLALFWSRDWPLVGDASLLHYVVFLLKHHRTPYQQVVDINLPGSYLVEAASMKVFGADAAGLRRFDGFLGILVCGCMAALSCRGWRERLFGLGAGCLFILIHLQDGLGQAGERDLVLTVLSLSAYVVLLQSAYLSSFASLFLFELLIGLTLTIKPTLILLAFLPVLMGARKEATPSQRLTTLSVALLGICMAPLGALLWLIETGALRSFVSVFSTIGMVHGQMGRRSLVYLFAHVSSPIILLLVFWIVLVFSLRSFSSRVDQALLFGAACGLVSYIVQGKGYPYQRYPFLAFFLILLARGLSRNVGSTPLRAAVSMAAVCVACLGLAPRFAHAVRSYNSSAPFQKALASDLSKRRTQVSRGVQCLDTFGGCINTLYDMGIVQSSPFLYDCYLFGPDTQRRESYRSMFRESLAANKPQLIILTDQFCFNGEKNFDRIKRWPELKRELSEHYSIISEWNSGSSLRWWSRSEIPTAYRIYALSAP